MAAMIVRGLRGIPGERLDGPIEGFGRLRELAGLAVAQGQHPQVRLEPRPGLADVGEPAAVGRVGRLRVGALVGLGEVLRARPLQPERSRCRCWWTRRRRSRARR